MDKKMNSIVAKPQHLRHNVMITDLQHTTNSVNSVDVQNPIILKAPNSDSNSRNNNIDSGGDDDDVQIVPVVNGSNSTSSNPKNNNTDQNCTDTKTAAVTARLESAEKRFIANIVSDCGGDETSTTSESGESVIASSSEERQRRHVCMKRRILAKMKQEEQNGGEEECSQVTDTAMAEVEALLPSLLPPSPLHASVELHGRHNITEESLSIGIAADTDDMTKILNEKPVIKKVPSTHNNKAAALNITATKINTDSAVGLTKTRKLPRKRKLFNPWREQTEKYESNLSKLLINRKAVSIKRTVGELTRSQRKWLVAGKETAEKKNTKSIGRESQRQLHIGSVVSIHNKNKSSIMRGIVKMIRLQNPRSSNIHVLVRLPFYIDQWVNESDIISVIGDDELVRFLNISNNSGSSNSSSSDTKNTDTAKMAISNKNYVGGDRTIKYNVNRKKKASGVTNRRRKPAPKLPLQKHKKSHVTHSNSTLPQQRQQAQQEIRQNSILLDSTSGVDSNFAAISSSRSLSLSGLCNNATAVTAAVASQQSIATDNITGIAAYSGGSPAVLNIGTAPSVIADDDIDDSGNSSVSLEALYKDGLVEAFLSEVVFSRPSSPSGVSAISSVGNNYHIDTIGDDTTTTTTNEKLAVNCNPASIVNGEEKSKNNGSNKSTDNDKSKNKYVIESGILDPVTAPQQQQQPEEQEQQQQESQLDDSLSVDELLCQLEQKSPFK